MTIQFGRVCAPVSKCVNMFVSIANVASRLAEIVFFRPHHDVRSGNGPLRLFHCRSCNHHMSLGGRSCGKCRAPKLIWQQPRFLQVTAILVLLSPSAAMFLHLTSDAALPSRPPMDQQSMGPWQTEYPDIGYTVLDSAPAND